MSGDAAGRNVEEGGGVFQNAVLVIDLVKDFTDPTGKVPHSAAARIVPQVDAFVRAARQVGALIVWVVDFHRAGKPDWELQHVRPHCLEGTAGVELAPPLEPLPQDYVLHKRRYSAFFATDLDLILRENGVRTLFLVGTKTNVCVRAAAQDAFQLGYRVVVPRECVSTDKVHLHQAALEDIGKYMGQVMAVQEALALIKGGVSG